MKKVFLHIGMHRTGTTSLQGTLHTNKELLAEHGFLYPKTGRISKKTSHVDLSPQFNSPLPKALWQSLREEIDQSDAQTILLSAEEFCTMHPSIDAVEKKVAFVHKNIPYPTEVVVYIRDKDSYVRSFYSLRAYKGIETRNLAQFERDLNYEVNLENMLRIWKKYFSVIERPYCSTTTLDFIEVCSLPFLVRVERKNRSISPKTVRIAIALNRLLNRRVRPWTLKYWYRKYKLDYWSSFLPISNKSLR